jgi:hypothetical protein
LREGKFIFWPFLTISIRIEAFARKDSTGEKASRSVAIGFFEGGCSIRTGSGIFFGHPERRSPRSKSPGMINHDFRTISMLLSITCNVPGDSPLRVL